MTAETKNIVIDLDVRTLGLGFTISGGQETGSPITVKKVAPDGAAYLAGLKANDILLSVNGHSLAGQTHDGAAKTISQEIKNLDLRFAVVRKVVDLEDVAVAQQTSDGQASRADLARSAFKEGDAELSRLIHETTATAKESHQTEAGQYIKSMVFGGLDGIITTFAVVASVNGANLSSGVVIIMGFANLIADGLSMGFGEYLSTLSELQYVNSERNREEWEFDNCPEGELKEMIDLYKEQGFDEGEAQTILSLMSKHREFFIDHMMVQELGLMPPDEGDSPIKAALVMFTSFVLFGLIPLLSYLALSTVDFGDNEADSLFGIAIALTGVALFLLGAIKSKFSTQSWYVSGFSVLINGAAAAGAAYLIGFGLERLVDIDNCPTPEVNATTTVAP